MFSISVLSKITPDWINVNPLEEGVVLVI